MTLTPIVTTEDVRSILNGVYSGSVVNPSGETGSYYFLGQQISSGSVQSQINNATYYLYDIFGKSLMETTLASDETKYYHLRTAELMYSCYRLVVSLSGGIITEGFSWSAGLQVSQPHIAEGYRNLISDFKDSALNHIKSLQTESYSGETDMPSYSTTSASMM